MNFTKRIYTLPIPDEDNTVIAELEFGSHKMTRKIVDAGFRNALVAADKIGKDLAKP